MRFGPLYHDEPLLTYERLPTVVHHPLLVRFHQSFLDFDITVRATLAQLANILGAQDAKYPMRLLHYRN
jgi:hypothetical protein